MTYYTEDELADLKREFQPRKRKSISCSDRMCGGADCQTCFPEGESTEREETNDAPTE